MLWTIPTSRPTALYGHHAPVHLVSGPVAGGRPVGVVRTAIVRIRVEAETMEVLTALEPLVVAMMELVAAVKLVATIPGQRGYRHLCHCQDRKCYDQPSGHRSPPTARLSPFLRTV